MTKPVLPVDRQLPTVGLNSPSALPSSAMERNKLNRMTILGKLKSHKSSCEELDERSSLPPRPSRVPTPWTPSRAPSTCATQRPLSGVELVTRFSDLHDVIVTHVNKFYSGDGAGKRLSQSVIEHASAGITLPWPQILGLLGDTDTKMAMLATCIAYTILGRSLLLKLGVSNSPGSTFLPPEIVECFQSFSLGKGAVTLGKDETNPVNFALLSRWKQTTAALCYTAYVTDAFSFFDARTVNIERALKDLDPLLGTYAEAHDESNGRDARLDDLRDVLRTGASLAFTLFGEPSYWKFDWRSDRAIAHGKKDSEPDPESFFDTGIADVAETRSTRLTNQEIVAWPSIVRVMDEDGVKLEGVDENVFGKKIYLNDLASTIRSTHDMAHQGYEY